MQAHSLQACLTHALIEASLPKHAAMLYHLKLHLPFRSCLETTATYITMKLEAFLLWAVLHFMSSTMSQMESFSSAT